jgi:putative transposase
MSYWRLYYHLVWGTRGRQSTIDGPRAAVLQRSFRATCREEGAIVHAIGIMPDHVHLAVSIPPRIPVAGFVRLLKGSSSHLVNRRGDKKDGIAFARQAEYGVVSFGERSRPDVVAYVENQKQRRADDPETDSLVITLRDVPIGESDEVRPGVIADFGEDGGVVRSEVLRASTVVANPRAVELALPA